MSKVPKYANMILLNDTPIIVVFQTIPYAEMVKDDLRVEHFERVFNVEMSEKTHALEVEYENEYTWKVRQIEYVDSGDAIKRAHAAMKAALPEESDDEIYD